MPSIIQIRPFLLLAITDLPIITGMKSAIYHLDESIKADLVRLETVNGFGFRRFFGLFWPLFDQKIGGNIDKSILPPICWIENRLKRTEKSTETKSVNSLLAFQFSIQLFILRSQAQ